MNLEEIGFWAMLVLMVLTPLASSLVHVAEALQEKALTTETKTDDVRAEKFLMWALRISDWLNKLASFLPVIQLGHSKAKDNRQ